MSAGPNAKPLGYDNFLRSDGQIISIEEAKKGAWKFTCDCGYKGEMGELLAEEGDDTLWCPACRSAGWIWD